MLLGLIVNPLCRLLKIPAQEFINKKVIYFGHMLLNDHRFCEENESKKIAKK